MANSTLSQDTVNLVNDIHSQASPEYQSVVPEATSFNISSVANPIIGDPTIMNEFINIMCRIGTTILKTKLFNNKLASLKMGSSVIGATTQEIFTDIPTVLTYDSKATTLMTVTAPKTLAAYHTLNDRRKTPISISEDLLAQSFVSWDTLGSYVQSVFNAMYSADNIKEYENMRNILTMAINNGFIIEKEGAYTDNEAGYKQLTKDIKTASGLMEFASTKYNSYKAIATARGEVGATDITQWCNKSEQVLFIKAEVFEAMDVDVLAVAFNMDKTRFMGRVITVDTFGETGDALNTLAILCDEKFLHVEDKLYKTRTFQNGETLITNYFLHHWQTMSFSPFVNAIRFTKTP